MHLDSICSFDQIHFREIILIFLHCLQTNICLRQVCVLSPSAEQALFKDTNGKLSAAGVLDFE